jgi:hypothetical protein
MTVAQLIEELKTHKQDAEVVVLGCSWVGSGGPVFFDAEPFVTEEKDGAKVVLQA